MTDPPVLLLVKDGQMLKWDMRKELVTEEELLCELRKQGVDELDKVKKAYTEQDGRISVIQVDGAQPQSTDKQQAF